MAFKVLLAVVLSWFIGQSIKVAISWHRHHKVNLWIYLEDGGMPSAHSASTVALTAAIYYETGLSALFVVAALFTLIVLNDTMKVRRQPGIQSELMAKFIDIREVLRRKLTESTGHTPEQVFVGALLGFVIASLMYAF